MAMATTTTLLPPPEKTTKSIELLIYGMNNAGASERIILDHPTQRSIAWAEVKWKSDFISSIVTGQVIHPLIFEEETQGGHLLVHDGKNRLSAVLSFAHDQFPLKKCDYLPDDFAGKLFSQLTSLQKKTFLHREILAYTYPYQTPKKELQSYLEKMNTHRKPHNRHELQKHFAHPYDSFLEKFRDQFFSTSIYCKDEADESREQLIINLKIAIALADQNTTVAGVAFDSLIQPWVFENLGQTEEEVEKNLERFKPWLTKLIERLKLVDREYLSHGLFAIHDGKVQVPWSPKKTTGKNSELFGIVCRTVAMFTDYDDWVFKSMAKDIVKHFLEFLPGKEYRNKRSGNIMVGFAKFKAMIPVFDSEIQNFIDRDMMSD